MTRTGSRPAGLATWLVLATPAVLPLGAGCAGAGYSGTGYAGTPSAPGAAARPPRPTAAEVLAPVRGLGRSELSRLEREEPSPAVALRRAHIYIETGAFRRAVTTANRVLFGPVQPSPEVRALAHYIRSRAYGRLGDAERAGYDRDRARELTVDADLRRRITADEPAAPVREASAARLRINDRADWRPGRARPDRMVPMTAIHRITVHHSGVVARPGHRYTAGAIRGIQRDHVDGRGWGDIGYHFLVDRGGGIWRGRALRWQGAHAGNPTANRGNVGICLLGNFVRGRRGQEIPDAQLGALTALIDALRNTYGIRADQVLTHRELRATECPGDRLHAEIVSLRRALVSRP